MWLPKRGKKVIKARFQISFRPLWAPPNGFNLTELPITIILVMYKRFFYENYYLGSKLGAEPPPMSAVFGVPFYTFPF